jgi:hypothetical protein
MHDRHSPAARPALIVATEAPALLPLLRDALSRDARRGPLALACLLDLTAPQIERIIAVWAAGLPAGTAAAPDVLLGEVQIHLAAALDRCPTQSETAVRAWVSVCAHDWLVQYATLAHEIAQIGAVCRRIAPEAAA